MKAALPLLILMLATACDERRQPQPVSMAPAAAPVTAGPATAPAPAPRDASLPYRAVGNEPGWRLTIDAARIDYLGDYGDTRISQPTPPPNITSAARTYRTPRLEVTISAGPCSDGMSDLIYRDTVRVRADAGIVNGCGGGTIAAAGLDGTSWSVTAINDRAVPRGDLYYVRFAGGQLSAGFGCNRFGGAYSLNGDHLSAPDLHATEMACGDPAMTFERLGGAVLSSNMRVERTDGTRMRLVSEAGSIDLRLAI